MAVPNQAVPAGSPSATPGGAAGAPIDPAALQAELAEARNQIKALSKYRAGMDQILREAPDAVVFDPGTGQVRWTEARSPAAPVPVPMAGGHPFGDLIEDPNAVNAWLNAQVQALLATQGYITNKQAEAMATNAYQAARGDLLVLRTIDRLLGNKKYEGLAEYGSPLSKKTAEILQSKGAQALDGAAGWDQWRYPAVGTLQEAADLARVALWEESQAGQTAVAVAQANQGAANLSQPGGGVPGAGIPGDESWKKDANDGNLIDRMRTDTANAAAREGIIK